MKNASNIVGGKSEGKRPLRRPKHIQELIRTDLREIGQEDVD